MSYSPYAPPGQTASQLGAGYLFHQSLGWKTTWTAVLIAISVVLAALVLGLAMVIGTPSNENLVAILLLLLVTIASQLISLAAGVLFLVWMHQASKNVHAFRRVGLDFTPGWCVAWWFIPFFNMWKPYQALKEIWLASGPSAVGGSDDAWRKRPVPGTFPLWWATYLISGVLGSGGAAARVLATIKRTDDTLATPLLWTSLFLSAMATVAVISIMRQLDLRQEAAASLTQSSPLP